MANQNKNPYWNGLRANIFGRMLNSSFRVFVDRTFMGGGRDFILEQASKASPSGDDTFLDLGAGSGYISLPLAKSLNNGKVICLDLSEDMLSILMQTAKKQGLENKIEIVCNPTSDTGLENESVHVIVTNAVMHELPDPRETIVEMNRILKPGGTIIIADFCKGNRYHHGDGHGTFSPEELANLFSYAGMTDIEINVVKQFILAKACKNN